MLTPEEVIRTAIREHPSASDEKLVLETALDAVTRTAAESPVYSPSTASQLQVCRFRCMLQDTGYPLEVYLPPGDNEEEDEDGATTDWTRLKERWVGWGVEVPGEQPWIKETLNGAADVTERMGSLHLDNASTPLENQLPDIVKGKWPLPGGDFQGALIKIYDPNVSYRPAAVYEFTGILSQLHLPASSDDFLSPIPDDTPAVLVPCIHVLTEPTEVYPLNPTLLGASTAGTEAVARDAVIGYLAELLPRHSETGDEDRTAAELLLLALIARVTSKAPGSVPLGTLSLNLLLPRAVPAVAVPAQNGTVNGIQNGPVNGTHDSPSNGPQNGSANGAEKRYPAFERLIEGIGRVIPLLVDVPLSIRLLSEHPFYPRSSHVVASSATPGEALAGESLQSGLLQLAPSTMVLINEDTLEGGSLQDRGVKNLQALAETVKTQKLRYEFPYVSEDFGMETDLGFVVVGQGKTLLPVDLHMPLLGLEPAPAPSSADHDITGIAQYLAQARAASRDLVIPADVAEFIQTEFIRLRREGLGTTPNGDKIAVGEADLRNWMRMGRLLALSYPGATFDREVWKRVLEIDLERKIRMSMR